MNKELTYTILLVDDESVNIDALGNILKRDYKLMVAKNGKKALELVEKKQPDVILLDINMPEMDGFEVANIIKKNRLTASIPIIFVTADTDQNSIIKAMKHNGSDYITKPIDPMQLQKSVRIQIEKLQLQRENNYKDKMIIQQSKLVAMGEMLSNIAHQWKQPLMMLSMANITLAKRSKKGDIDNAYIQSYVQKSQELIERMNQTIIDFTDYINPQNKETLFDVVSLIQKSIGFMQSVFKHSNIEVKLNNSSEIKLMGFENFLNQVLINLLQNSVDAIKANSIKVGVITIQITSHSEQVIIEVIDNGGGIDEAIIDRIFEPYFSTKFKDNGTGLGLYMSRNLVEKSMNGNLLVNNIEGGANFKIILPQKQR